jgi:hypothetical protein
MLGYVACQDDKQRGSAMKSKLLTAVIAAAFMTVSGASWAYVGGNTIVKYPNADASKNKKVVNHGVGGNSAPSYPATPGSKNKKVVNHGVGGNSAPSYPATSK